MTIPAINNTKRSVLGWIILLLGLSALGHQTIAQTWTRTQAPYGRHLNDVFIGSETNAIVVGGNPSNDSIGSVFPTSTSGVYWNITLDIISPQFNSLAFSSSQLGVTVGDAGAIYNTQDGGSSWNPSSSPLSVNLNEVLFINQDKGFIVGGKRSSDSTQVILGTTDGGDTWNVVRNQAGARLISLTFFDSDKAIAVGEAGVVLKTENGGVDWNPVSTPVIRDFNAVEFIDSNTGFIVGGRLNNDSIRTIIKTVDGGDNWSIILDETGGWLEDIEFVDSNIGYAVGDAGTVLRTVNGGDDWSAETLPDGGTFDSYRKVVFLNPDYGMIVGRLGAAYVFHNSPIPEVETVNAIVGATETNATLYGNINTFGAGARFNFFFDTNPQMTSPFEYPPVPVVSNSLIEASTVIGGLTPGQTYYYFIRGYSLSGNSFGDTLSFEATISPPSAHTVGAQVLPSETEVNLYGTANTFGLDGAYTFLIDTVQELLNPIPLVPDSFNTVGPQGVSNNVEQLTSGQTYFYSIKVSTIAGESYGDTLSFSASLPFTQLSLDSVADEPSFQPSFYGTADGFTEDAELFFEYGTTLQMVNEVSASPSVISDGNNYLVSYSFGSPIPEGIVYVRLKAITQSGSFFSNTLSFYNGVLFTSFETISASYDILTGQTTFEGFIEGLTIPCDLQWQYWSPTGGISGDTTGNPATVSDGLPYAVTGTVSGLTPENEYFAQLNLLLNGNSISGGTVSFFTGIALNQFETKTATEITPNSAQLNGFASGLDMPADVYFEYGETPQFGETAQANPNQINSPSDYSIELNLGGLEPNTLYYYRLKGNISGNEFYGGTHQFYTGPPEIPNWDFQQWQPRTVDLPNGWVVFEDNFQQVNLGGGNSAMRLVGPNVAIMGFILDGEEGELILQSFTPFVHRPDSVFIELEYFIEPEDTALFLVQLDSADVTISFGFHSIAGNSNGNTVELGFPIEYLVQSTPQSVSLGIINGNFNAEGPASENNLLVIDRVHFGGQAPTISSAEFNDWTPYSYQHLLGDWAGYPFLSDLPEPVMASPVLYNPPNDTALRLVSKNYGGNVVEADIKTGESIFDESPFEVSGFHQVLTGYLQFDRQGNDTLTIDIDMTEEINGPYLGFGRLNIVETVSQMTAFEIPIRYDGNSPFTEPIGEYNPNFAKISVGVKNSDGVSLSTVTIDKLCFDGFYIGEIEPDNVSEASSSKSLLVYPNPTTGHVSLEGIKNGDVFELFDLKGRKVFSKALDDNQHSINLSEVSSGIYSLVITSQSQQRYRKSQKIVIISN